MSFWCNERVQSDFLRRRLQKVLASAVCVAFCAGAGMVICAQQSVSPKVSESADSRIVAADSTTLHIGAGDVVDVQVFETPELSAKTRVDQQGDISLPVTGEVHLAGLTTVQASVLVERRLRERRLMLEPHVTVSVSDFATEGVSVLGEVKSPGNYLLLGPHTLYGALAAAGGVSQNQGPTITLTHAGNPAHPLVLPASSSQYSELLQTTEVFPGDLVVVSRAETLYVVGDVGRSGEFPLRDGKGLRVLDVVALAQGANKTAATTKASIVRETPDGVQTIPVDLDRIAKNKAPDPIMQPNDVLVVPSSAAKTFLTYALPSLTAAAVSSVSTALVLR